MAYRSSFRFFCRAIYILGLMIAVGCGSASSSSSRAMIKGVKLAPSEAYLTAKRLGVSISASGAVVEITDVLVHKRRFGFSEYYSPNDTLYLHTATLHHIHTLPNVIHCVVSKRQTIGNEHSQHLNLVRIIEN